MNSDASLWTKAANALSLLDNPITEGVPSPQPGPQTAFLQSDADIVIYGGAAGGGKTFGLFLHSVMERDNPNYRFVYFRRQQTDINKAGGPWDKSMDFFPQFSAFPNKTSYKWRFPSGAEGQFASLQYDADVLNWQTAEIARLYFDELTHFTSYQFWYMLSRNRSTSGVKCQVRAGTNPDAGSWVKKLIAPWVDENWPERDKAESGEIRWIARDEEGEMVWVDADWRYKANESGYEAPPKSITFIASKLSDNKALTDIDPTYESNLLMQDSVTAARLLGGDWSVRELGFFDDFCEQPPWVIDPAFTPKSPPPSWYRFIGGLDWGYRDPFAFVLASIGETGHKDIMQSLRRNRLTNSEQASLILTMLDDWGIKPDQCLIYCDGTMWYSKTINGIEFPPDIQDFITAGLICIPCPVGEDSNRDRYTAIQKEFHNRTMSIYRGFNRDLVDSINGAKSHKNDTEKLNHDICSHLIVALGNAIAPYQSAAEKPKEDNRPLWELNAQGTGQGWLNGTV